MLPLSPDTEALLAISAVVVAIIIGYLEVRRIKD